MKYWAPICTLGLFFLSGCGRVTTDKDFSEIQTQAQDLTGHELYWDTSLENTLTTQSVVDLLQNPLSLNDMVQVAVLNNRALQATYEDLGIAKANLIQASLLKNPIFAFYYVFSTSASQTPMINLGLMQNFLDLLLIPLKKKLAGAELEQAKHKVIEKVLWVEAETKKQFYILSAAKQMYELKKQVLFACELSYEMATKLRKAGNITELQALFEQSTYEKTKLELSNLQALVLETKEALNALMGLYSPHTNWEAETCLPELPGEHEPLESVEKEALLASIDLQIASEALIAVAAESGIDTAKLIMPQLDIGPLSQFQENVWFYGPAINIALPIFDIGRASSYKAQAKIRRQWDLYSDLALQIRTRARTAKIALLNTFSTAQHVQNTVLPLAKESLHQTLLMHNALQVGIFEVLIAKKSELEDEITLTRLSRDYWIEKTQLDTLLKGYMLP